MSKAPTALIADDEPLLRESLRDLLATAWPELRIVADARNGREAIKQFEGTRPDICFLDVKMPGLSGIDVARHIARRAHIVFVSAYDKYALAAFEHGVIDYLVKPVEPDRLSDTVKRLQERLRQSQPAALSDAVLQQLAEQLQNRSSRSALQYLRASLGDTIQLIPVEDIDYLRADNKYTRIAWRSSSGRPADALIRRALSELATELDAARFVQVHRSIIVNLAAVDCIVRHDNDTAEIRLKHREERLPVSRNYLSRLRQM